MIPTLSDALAARGYDTLTDVQTAVTDPALAASDLLVSAQTGSGKTVGFGLAIAPTLLDDEGRFGPAALPVALIVAPTRELAVQVARELAWLYAGAGGRIATCIGGMDARDERRNLERGAHIVVGTPGRLCDHLSRGALDLSELRAVVLDEADEMLDLGFRDDLEVLLAAAPETRRTLLFSATVPPAIAALAQTYQRDAVRISTVAKGTQHADIAYQAIEVAEPDLEHAIINLLRFHDAPTAIVFANTRATVARLTARLSNRGFAVVSLSGELSQDERSHALQALRDKRARVCVATDVAARGIDLAGLDLVVHADLPTSTETLLHRSGRTGRAGRKGLSVLMVPGRAARKAERLLKWAKIDAAWVAPPSPEEILAKDEARLLEDEAWNEPPNETEAAFAARLIAAHGPEALAVACLRLFRAQLSAPEELGQAGETRAKPKEFGPATWLALSIGRATGAEPRWILPLLCRTLDLDKAQIGRIRVLDTETYVEIAEPALAGHAAALSAGMALDGDVSARVATSLPEDVTRPPQRSPRPDREDRPERGERAERPRGPRPERRERDGDWTPRPRPRPVEASTGATDESRPPRPPRPAPGDAPRGPRKEVSDRPRREAGDKPRWKAEGGPERPRRDFGDKPRRPADGDARPRRDFGDKPRWKAEGTGDDARPRREPGDRPRWKAEGAPRKDGPRPDRAERPFPKRADDRGPRKPAGGPGAARGPAKPAKPAPKASDTSKRFTPPGARPRPVKGGETPPRRKG